MFRRKPAGQIGFTLIEVLVALTLFTIITLGVTPVMISSLKGAALSRSFTKGKNVAVEAMERIRGLPYFASVGSETAVTEGRVDILDLYFPDTGSGFQSATNSFVTTCTPSSQSPAASATLACPPVLPAGHTVTFEATFVTPNGATFDPVVPGAYNWNSTNTETAPSPLLKMIVTVSWTQNGESRSTTLTTLLSERDLAKDKVRGIAKIDYVVQGFTGYVDSSGIKSNLVAQVGSSESKVASRTVTSADQTVETARVTLTPEDGAYPDEVFPDVLGLSTSLHAPPNNLPGTTSAAAPPPVTHPQLGTQIATLGSQKIVSSQVQLLNDLPSATGGFEFKSDSALGLFNDPGPQGGAELHLTGGRMLSVDRTMPFRLSGATSANATALTPTAGRKVEASATADFATLRMLPADFVTDIAIVVIKDFTANLSCRATASAGTAVSTGTWSATLKFWRSDVDTTGDGVPDPGYAELPLSGSVGSSAGDPLADIRDAENPLVYDDPDDNKDVYLFDDGEHGYYLEDWSSQPVIQSSVDGVEGRSSTVDLESAIRIVSAPVNPAVSNSNVIANIGSLSCEAVDKRGL